MLYMARMAEAGSRKCTFKLWLDDWSASDNIEENAVNGGLESVAASSSAKKKHL